MSTEKPKAARTVPCPHCRKPTPYAPTNQHRPFCSAVCKDSDIIAWAEGSYAIAGPTVDEAARRKDERDEGDVDDFL